MKEGVADDQHKDDVPTSDQIVLKGFFMGSEMSLLKDDGCNTSTVSKERRKKAQKPTNA